MPRGIPGNGKVTAREDLVARMEEIQARLAQYDNRAKHMKELREWIDKRGLDHMDVLAIYRMMKPKVSKEAVVSRNPLGMPANGQPLSALKHLKKTLDGKKYYVREGGIYRGDPKAIKYSNGTYVWGGSGRQPEWFGAHIKKGGRLTDLLIAGAEPGPKHIKRYMVANGRG